MASKPRDWKPERPEPFVAENDDERAMMLKELVKSPGWRLVMGEFHDLACYRVSGWARMRITEATIAQRNEEIAEANAIFGILKWTQEEIARLQERVGKGV